MTGLDRTQRYLVVCGELDSDTTFPNSRVDECQAAEVETSAAAVSTAVHGTVTDPVRGTSDTSRNKSPLPSFVIGKFCTYCNEGQPSGDVNRLCRCALFC